MVGYPSEPLLVTPNSHTSTGDSPMQVLENKYWQASATKKKPNVKFTVTTPEQAIWLNFYFASRYSRYIVWTLTNDNKDVVDNGVRCKPFYASEMHALVQGPALISE